MWFARQTKRNEAAVSKEEDLDEFDRILIFICMSMMQDHTSPNEITNFASVMKFYQMRAKNHDFPVVSLVPYLNFGMLND